MELTHKSILLPDVPHDGTLNLILHDTQGNEIFPGTRNTPWSEYWEGITTSWAETVAAYENDPNDFYNAWNYLDLHPAFWKFRYGTSDPQPARTPKKPSRTQRLKFWKRPPVEPEFMPLAERLHVRHLEYEYGIHRCVDIMVGKVTDEEGPGLRPEVWVEIELGQHSWPEEYNPADPNSGDKKYHDYKLDATGPTVEKAIIRAAYNVWCVYGNDRRVCDAPYNELAYKTVVDDETFEELMRDTEDEPNERVRRAARSLREATEEG